MRPPFSGQPQKLNKTLVAKLTQLLKLAVDSQNAGQIDKAKSYYQQVVKLQPGNFECWHILAIFEYQNKNYVDALALFKKVISIHPKYAPAHCNMGLVLHEMGQLGECLLCYDKALALDPELSAAYNNKGNSLKELGRTRDALQSYLTAISYQPDYAQALYNVAEAYKLLHEWASSLHFYNRAIAAKFDYSEAYNNRGLLLQFLNRVDDAIDSFNRTIEITPQYAPAHSNKSLALLLKGDFKQGWHEHEWRWKMKEFTSAQRNFLQPQWTGKESLFGKTILIHCEQGLGDTLQFCRYLQLLQPTGAVVFVEVQESLYSLLTQIMDRSQLIKQGDTLPNFDYHCPIISLPNALYDQHPSIPSKDSYLRADPSRLLYWTEKLGEKRKKRLGWVWRGNKFHHNDEFRSLPLETLLPYLKQLGEHFELFGLQKELRNEEIAHLKETPYFVNLSELIRDFEDTAALCEVVDIVITVDTSVAHLSGALGRPTYLMLPFAPDWRWMLKRSDSPWYPSFKIFRQESILNWKSVLDSITTELNNCD